MRPNLRRISLPMIFVFAATALAPGVAGAGAIRSRPPRHVGASPYGGRPRPAAHHTITHTHYTHPTTHYTHPTTHYTPHNTHPTTHYTPHNTHPTTHYTPHNTLTPHNTHPNTQHFATHNPFTTHNGGGPALPHNKFGKSLSPLHDANYFKQPGKPVPGESPFAKHLGDNPFAKGGAKGGGKKFSEKFANFGKGAGKFGKGAAKFGGKGGYSALKTLYKNKGKATLAGLGLATLIAGPGDMGKWLGDKLGGLTGQIGQFGKGFGEGTQEGFNNNKPTDDKK